MWLLVAACVLLAGSAGCRKTRRTPDDTLVVLVDTSIKDLDPRFLQGSLPKKVSRLVVPGLVTVDNPTLEPALDLAESIERVDDVTWIVTVKPGIRFSDGTPLTAEDVAYTFRSVIDPEMKSFLLSMYQERLESVEVLDERRVRFRLKQPLATFLTDLDMGILSKRAATARAGERWSDGTAVGAGPFRAVKVSEEEVILERNEHYFGEPPPMRRLVFKTLRDPNSRLLVLVGGSADFLQNAVRFDLVDEVVRSPRLEARYGPSAILTYVLFQNRHEILSDPRVRRAIALAVDRERIVKTRFGGHAVLATGLLPPGHWAYHGDVRRVTYDPEAAGRLLDEAGYPDPDGPGGRPRFKLTYKTSSDAFRVSIARLIAQQLGEVGIEVEVRPYEWHVFFSDIKQGNFELASVQTADIVEPDMYNFYFHTEWIPSPERPNVGNRSFYSNPEVDRLIEAGRRELDREERKRIYARIQEILAEDLPIFPLWHEDVIAVTNVDVQGYEVLPNASYAPLVHTSKRR